MIVNGMTCQEILWALGGAAELVGLITIALDVHDARKAAGDVVEDEPRFTGATFQRPRTDAFITASPVPDTPLAERVDLLEKKVDALRQDVVRHDRALEASLTERVEKARTEARRQARERDRALRNFIALQLGAAIGRRVFGVAAVALGVVLSTVANFVG
jgi:hypothetical protein